ncbi:uncharacterized protein LDX57_000915 [Aspergillus melleus]|uniref:uncharacterized protein n=1 Tax=Aspergillus melleus TaxID=138277 RepID=UPI001E8D1D48|nr:uncharacterized protein LDX57_000915 [Aspergillus melleus]KAH8423160.1 hypothetical protein LDX57_000915 [Aspergillus melleus]
MRWSCILQAWIPRFRFREFANLQTGILLLDLTTGFFDRFSFFFLNHIISFYSAFFDHISVFIFSILFTPIILRSDVHRGCCFFSHFDSPNKRWRIVLSFCDNALILRHPPKPATLGLSLRSKRTIRCKRQA